MSYRSPYNMSLRLLLTLMMLYEVRTLPALETAPGTTAANSIEETDKLPDTHVEPIASNEAALTNANATNQTSTGNNETVEPTDPGDIVGSASSNEPVSIYAGGLITPEAFQQYLSQYGGAAGLAPLAAGYPAPITGAPGIYPYPGPIMVQTGYEGFLMPANQVNADSASDSTTTVVAAPSPVLNPLMAFASRLLPTILMSTLFRIAAVILSAVGIIFFGGAITNALCRATQICDIPNKAVNYLRFGGAQDVGRMIAEEITPERVRRTTEFVRNAIHKYRQLQKLVEPETETD